MRTFVVTVNGEQYEVVVEETETEPKWQHGTGCKTHSCSTSTES